MGIQVEKGQTERQTDIRKLRRVSSWGQRKTLSKLKFCQFSKEISRAITKTGFQSNSKIRLSSLE